MYKKLDSAMIAVSLWTVSQQKKLLATHVFNTAHMLHLAS